MKRSSYLPIMLISLSLAGCKNEPVVTYRVSKEAPPVVAAPAHREIDWTVPAGWRTKPASEMRIGSFIYKAKNGESVDISVVALAGDAGGDLANINRWRGQIGLAPVTDLEKNSERIDAGGRRMRFVDLENSRKRLAAAIWSEGGKTWFFKMSGEDAAVRSALPSFRAFLSSVKVHEHH